MRQALGTRTRDQVTSFHSGEAAATDSSSCVCDLTADSDPDAPNDSKIHVRQALGTRTQAPRAASTWHKNKGPSFHSGEAAATDSSSCVCDLTADSDPDGPNDSKMLLDLPGDSDSDRPTLKHKNDNAETREVETGVDMSWETAEARLREWDVNSKFGPCTSTTTTTMAPRCEPRSGSTSLGLQDHADVPRTRRSTYLER